MLYIIGGTSRSGKSLLARNILKEKLVPFFPLDGLTGMLKSAVPEHGIKHDMGFISKAEKTWKFNKSLFNHFIVTQESYTVEGDSILPLQVAKLKEKYFKNIKCCFLGYCTLSAKQKLDLVRTFHVGEKDWTHKHDDEAMLGMIEGMIQYSKYLKEECNKYNIAFFDVSEDFENTQTKAFEFLVR